MSASREISGPSLGPTQQPPASTSQVHSPAFSSQSIDASTSSPPRRKRTTPRKRKVPRVYRPDEGSIYDIMHDNSGKSLYVLPICWTDLHATLLGASFTEGAPIVTPVPQSIHGQWLDPSLLARQLTDQLHTLIRNEPSMTRVFCKNMAMKNAMGIFFPDRLANPKMNAELDIYFGQRVFRKAVRIPCLWKTLVGSSFATIPTVPNDSFYVPNSPQEPQPEIPQQTPNMPILAYFNKSQLALIRQNLFRIIQTPFNPNDAVAGLQALRSKHLIPADVDQDPYLVAMMVSMAQSNFYQDALYSQKSDSQQSTRSSNGKLFELTEPKFEDTKVAIISHDEGIENNPRFLVYTATVTADYMERWLYPLKVPQSSKKAKKQISLDITMTPVPFWPILGLKERLARALGKDLVGPDVYSDLYPDHIGFWDLLVEPRKNATNNSTPPKNESNSRKRRADRQGGRESQSSPSDQSQSQSQSQRQSEGSQGYNSQGSATSSQSQSRGDSESDSQREPLSEVYNSSFEEEAPESDATTSPTRSEADRADRADRDRPVLSPNTKRRRTARSVSAVEVR
ncbi:hypothetical protein QR685DRAFT_341981 [Neurospora intermedia]|uniref:Uncharacterized protein n=1 Tax=Neurospora intermedia TaxID=5142 RepID=A0ABR3D713_NEUIN